ncbi:D-3-phosphoglycerate dehydrogenase [Planctomycetes bacterium Pan216]|uniref:D-3-phosphoglycerate dehydrogenase n=1 Tax=Kolteria novifilia TaxID=2527975 RepID=A0A518BD49_9BACT|nr:D-3-phosphoglycerate dehydrogenase [Planctomycetes bacterium Pan216]
MSANDSEFTILALEPAENLADRVRREFPSAAWVDGTSKKKRDRALPAATVVFGTPTKKQLEHAAALRWLHLPATTLPKSLRAAIQRPGLDTTLATPVYAGPVAERALGVMLAMNLRHEETGSPSPGDLAGGVAAVIGTGRLGRSVARLLRAVGMQVLGARRHPEPTLEIDEVFGPDEIATMVARADWVIVALPATSETEGLIDHTVLDAMSPGARLLTLSDRGIVDESALQEAIRSKRLRGAGFLHRIEELPTGPEGQPNNEDPLWSMRHVKVVPHRLDRTAAFQRATEDFFLRNLHLFAAGSRLLGTIRYGRP